MPEHPSPCPTDDRLAALRSPRLDAGERQALEEHLSTCHNCRRRLVLSLDAGDDGILESDVPDAWLERVQGLAPTEPSDPAGRASTGLWTGLWKLAAVFVAAALGLFLVWRPVVQPSGQGLPMDVDTSPADLEILRDAPSPPDGRVLLVSPVAGATVPSTALDLRWTPMPEARRYTVSILSSLGDVLHRETTPESRVRIDLSREKHPGPDQGPYFWYVTVELVDGRVLESEIRSITLE